MKKSVPCLYSGGTSSDWLYLFIYRRWHVASFIGIFLIFGAVGQSFMQIAMSNTVSRTLSKEHIGVGMGLFSMITFISTATSTAVIGKILDLGTSTIRLNPIPQNSTTIIYSNIFMVLAILIVVVASFYYVQFGRAVKMDADE